MGRYWLQATFKLSPNLGDERVRRQRLDLAINDLDSVGELYTEDDFRQLIVTVETRPTFSHGELEDHGKRGLIDRHLFVRTVRWWIVANELSMTVVVFPVFSGEVVEGQEGIAIFDRTLAGSSNRMRSAASWCCSQPSKKRSFDEPESDRETRFH